ncbi:hypothetical protein, partial, partial [Parasitella parasitica]
MATNNGISASRYAPGNQEGALPGQEEGGREGGQDPIDLSDLRGHAVPMSSVDNMSQHDGESVREMFLGAKSQYDGLVHYFSSQRQEWIDNMNARLSQAQMIAQSLEHLHPQNRIVLQGIIQERQQLAEEDRAKVEHFDSNVEATRQEIWNTLVGILHAGPGGVMNDLVHEFGWPTLEACQDLGLPMDYQYMITGTYNASTITR